MVLAGPDPRPRIHSYLSASAKQADVSGLVVGEEVRADRPRRPPVRLYVPYDPDQIEY